MLIAVVCALALGHDANAQPLNLCWLRILLACSGIALSGFAAKLIVIACEGSSPPVSAGWIRRMHQLHLVLWLALAGFLVFIVDWVTIVRTNWNFGTSILIDELLILAPLVAPWILSWVILYDLDATNRQRGSFAATANDRLKFAWLNLQMVFGIGIIPVLVVCFVGDVAALVDPELVEGKQALALFAVPMLFLMLAYPEILRRFWKTRPLTDASLQSRLAQFAKDHGIKVGKLRVWQTDGRVANALVTGLLPRLRTVLFTDRLLDILTDDEVEAALAHEMGHIAKFHLPLRLVALALPMMVCSLLSDLFTLLNPAISEPSDLSVTVGVWCLVGITLLYMWLALGWYSRQLEHEADLWACLRLKARGGEPAVRTYVDALSKLTGGSGKRGWLHPSLEDRIAFIHHSLIDETVAARFSTRLRTLAWIGTTVLVLGLMGLAFAFAGQ